MGIKDYFAGIYQAARRKQRPERDTVEYPRLNNLGVIYNQKAQIKQAPPNIRYFSRTPYARQAIRRIRDPLCSLDWKIAPRDGVKTNRVLDKQIAVATTCFHHPNQDNNWRDFLGQITEDWLVFGAAVFEQQLGNDPIRPLWLWPVDAQSIQIFAGWSGSPNEARYIQTIGYTNVGFLEGRKLRNDELVYIRANSSTQTPFGFGALEVAFDTVNRQLGVAQYSGNLATNAQPQSMLYFSGAGEETLRAFRLYWRNEVEGQGVTPMFGGVSDAKSIDLHPGNDKALYLEYQQFVIREIAIAFGLSPMNLGVEHDVNRNTAEVAEERDWNNTVVPLAELISSYITREVLHARLGFYHLEFSFEGLYREDEKNIADIYETEYTNNAVTPNEYRAERGLPPMDNEWGDRTFADFQIAMSAARGTKEIADPDLPGGIGDKPDDSQKLNQQTRTDSETQSDFESD